MTSTTDNVQRIKPAPWMTEVAKADVSAHAKALAVALFLFARAEGDRCFPSNDTLMEHANLARATVVKARAELVQAGLVNVASSGKGGRGNAAASYYTLTVPAKVADTLSDKALVLKPIKTLVEHLEARAGVFVEPKPFVRVKPEVEPEPVVATVTSIDDAREAAYRRGTESRKRAAALFSDVVAPRFNNTFMQGLTNDDEVHRPVRDVMAKYLDTGMAAALVADTTGDALRTAHAEIVAEKGSNPTVAEFFPRAATTLRGYLAAASTGKAIR